MLLGFDLWLLGIGFVTDAVQRFQAPKVAIAARVGRRWHPTVTYRRQRYSRQLDPYQKDPPRLHPGRFLGTSCAPSIFVGTANVVSGTVITAVIDGVEQG